MEPSGVGFGRADGDRRCPSPGSWLGFATYAFRGGGGGAGGAPAAGEAAGAALDAARGRIDRSTTASPGEERLHCGDCAKTPGPVDPGSEHGVMRDVLSTRCRQPLVLLAAVVFAVVVRGINPLRPLIDLLDEYSLLLMLFVPPLVLLAGVIGLVAVAVRWKQRRPFRLVAVLAVSAVLIGGVLVYGLLTFDPCPGPYDPEDVTFCGSGGWN